ncbi:MAG: DHH family phosphoesterase, partial [Ruminococcus sp.]|nr:DHH family phosphoesterase [Candidatus Copronaster equi]
FAKPWLGIIELIALIAVALVIIFSAKSINKKRQEMLDNVSTNLNFSQGNASGDFPLPVAVCSMSGDVKWFNDRFKEVIGKNSSSINELSEMFDEVNAQEILKSSLTGISTKLSGKYFDIYSHKSVMNDEDVITMYFVETTKYRQILNKFVNTRPVIAIMTIDNINEIKQNYKDSDCAAIRNGIEKLVEDWVSVYQCFVSKINYNNFYVVCDKSSLDDMVERKFDILDKVRDYDYEGKYVGATLAIGAGLGKDYAECEKNAKLSLDMAFGRGGDQAVIKNNNEYKFFGGISKSVDNSSKVKSRIIASTLSELIQGCENVFVMGHRFPDFDAIGSALGVSFLAKFFGKDAYIVLDEGKNMAKPLIDRAKAEGFEDVFISHEKAISKFSKSKKNLLVVVDTHIKDFVECQELLDLSRTTVVIDHHRKAVNFIDDTVIFFHDPSASSASEMVTEVIEYTPAVSKTGSFIADALFAGIMLDTKHFILRADSDTFEAAAYLKENGADAVRVKKLFANDFETYQYKNKIINSAMQYKNCAVAIADFQCENLRLVCAQAADELLSINNIDASFVVFRSGDVVCVSARSYGAVNVQIVMEYMNGGGHQTMAATQIKSASVENVRDEVYRSIEKYYESK